MRKLTLESLKVESFEVSGVKSIRGTVTAHGVGSPYTAELETCTRTGAPDCTIECSRHTECPPPCGESYYFCEAT